MTAKEQFVTSLQQFKASAFNLLEAWSELEMSGELETKTVPDGDYPFAKQL